MQALLMKKYCERADFLGEFDPEKLNAVSFKIPEGANLLQINITDTEES